MDPDDNIDADKIWQNKQMLREKSKSKHQNCQEMWISELQQHHHPTAGTYQHKFGYFQDNAKLCV